MKKILAFSLLAVLMFAACRKDIHELNEDVKNPSTVSAASLFTGAVKSLVDNMTTPNVNIGVFRLLAQHWTETTYTDESNYDLSTRNITQNFWNVMYRDVLGNLAQSARQVLGQDTLFTSPQTIRNQNALIEIMTVYTYSVLVETYGDIPYSQALNVNDVTPVYDDASTIYTDLIRRLDAAISQIDQTAGGFGINDVLMEDDLGKWYRFANSLKLRMGLMIADVNPDLARVTVESAAPNVLTSNEDNVSFKYLSSPPNTNPIWVDLVQSGRKDFVAANTLVDTMVALNDPRVQFYFTTDENGEYNGGEYGSSNNYATYSKPSATITRPDFPSTLMSYSEVRLLLAESVERGFNVGGTAEEHYNAGVTASIEQWGGSAADAAAYLAQPEVDYTTATGTFRDKIGTQLWIALYNQGYEAWTQWRRLDAPSLVAPPDAISDIPVRFTYPVQEQNLNTINYNTASTSIGGDEVETKLFWDIY